MSELPAARQAAQAPRIGFIGWGAENAALLQVLAEAFPGLEATAPCFLPGGAGRAGYEGQDEAAARAAAGLPTLPTLPTLEALFAACDMIVVETTAQAFERALPQIRLVIAERHMLVLMGQGWKLQTVQRQLNDRKLVRCLVRPFPGQGDALLAFYATPQLETPELEAFRGLFGRLELVLELESEAQFEVVLGLAGLTPVAIFTIMDALADGALMMGLPRGPALKFIASMLLGSAQSLLESGEHPAVLREAALQFEAAATGLMELESAGIRGLMMRAVREAMAELRAESGGGKTDEKG